MPNEGDKMMDNALKQYIDLYGRHRQAFEQGCAPKLNQMRNVAASLLREMKLPREGSENYEITSLTSLMEPDYGVNVNRGDHYGYTANAFKAIPQGVTVSSLNDIENPLVKEMVDTYYGDVAAASNPIVALNSLLIKDGVLIHVSKGVKSEKPLQLLSNLKCDSPLLSPRRVLIVLEKGAELTLILRDHTPDHDVASLNLQVIEAVVDEGAHLQLYDVEETSSKTTRLSSLYLVQEGESKVTINGSTLSNGTTRNEYYTQFNAEGSHLSLSGMGILNGDRRLDTYSYAEHGVGHCTTDELFKYVLDERAKGAFTGLVKVDEGAVKTEAYQANRNIVGSDEARLFSKPQLEIYNDDVKCSHGSAIGRLDEMQLFYMRTRGIPEAVARQLLKQAFVADVIEKVQLPALRDRLTELVEKSFTNYEL